MQRLDVMLTLMVLSVAALLHAASRRRLAAGLAVAFDWARYVAHAIPLECRACMHKRLLMALQLMRYQGDDPVLDALCIRYEELIATDVAVISGDTPRGPPAIVSEAA